MTRSALALVRRAQPEAPEHPLRAHLRRQRAALCASTCHGRARAPRWARMLLQVTPALMGLILGRAWGEESAMRERELRVRAEETAEVLSGNSDWIACQMVHSEIWIHGLPGWEEYSEMAERVGAQLTPSMREWCRSGGFNGD